MSSSVLNVMFYVMDFFIIAQCITSAIMCVYGYKWRKGLIATMSIYIGIALGVVISGMLLNLGVGVGGLWAIPITALIFWYSAYKIVWLNHFLAGFLLTVKISYMIIYTLMDNEIMDANVGILLVAPIIIGIFSGIIILGIYNNYVVILCTSFIGAVELGSKIVEFVNNGMFVITQDIGYIFDPIEFILGIFGVDSVGLGEVVLILVFFICSFLWQRYLVIKNGIILSDTPFDDRKKYNSED